MMGRPFSQHVDADGIDGGAAALFDACDWAPGLIAPVCTPVADTAPGLIDGAVAPAETGDWALAVVVAWPPPPVSN